MPKVVVSLLAKELEYQTMQAVDAEKAAARAGFDVETIYADNKSRVQIEQLNQRIQLPESERPVAILAQTVLGDGLPVLAREAAMAGIGWILLNRDGKYIDSLREERPRVPVGVVTIDQEAIGRIQAGQLKQLLPNGGNVIYVQGPPGSFAARRRLETLLSAVAGWNIDIHVVAGEWTEESGAAAVSSWLQHSAVENIHVIAAQNDAMAVGAQRAMASKNKEWAALPVIGCDGLAAGGQTLVSKTKLAATIIVPPVAGAAIDLIARHRNLGTMPPARTIIAPRPFPAA